MKQLAILFLSIYILSGGVAQAATYYVDKSGSDNNSCAQAQLMTAARLTVVKGITCLSAGDTLLVRGGIYREEIRSVPSGISWSNLVRIAGYPGETAWLAPVGTSRVIDFTGNESYIEFDRINLDGRGIESVTTVLGGTSNHVRFQNAEAIGGPKAGNCAIFCGGTDSEFINLVIHGGGAGGGCGTPCANYAWYSGGSNNLVERCDIYDVSSLGIQIYNGSGAAASNNIIRNNRIHDIVRSGDNFPGGRITGIIVASGSNNQVYNNVVYNLGRDDGGSTNAAISVYGGGTTGTKIWNNTLYANHHYGVVVSSGVADTRIQNNIVYGNFAGAYIDEGTGTTRDHNIEATDPMVVNPGAGDFRLQAGSPAINAGISLPGVTADFAGVARPQGSAPDIGAHEYRAGEPSPPAPPENLRIVP